MMTPHDALHDLESRLRDHGLSLAGARIEGLITLLAASTETTRPDGLADSGGEEDMLIAEWGQHFEHEVLEVLLVRQFILSTGAIWQLQIRQTYAHAPEGLHVPGSSDWQLDAEGFLAATRSMRRAFAGALPLTTRIGLDQM